jgi:hypothetical protein
VICPRPARTGIEPVSLAVSTALLSEFAHAAHLGRRQFIHVVVETPRGAQAKLTYDSELKIFVLSKSLMLGLSYALFRPREPTMETRSMPSSFTMRRPTPVL